MHPADLGPLEDFHTMGRYATAQLVDLLENSRDHRREHGARRRQRNRRHRAVRRRPLGVPGDRRGPDRRAPRNQPGGSNGLVGLDNLISVQQADVTELPFADATFDVAISQHVQMNVADKARLYSEARRVLVNGGRLALWDTTIG